MELNNQIADITRQDRLLTQLKHQGLVDPDLFISRRDAPEFLDTFDEELFREIVDKIIVESNERLRFRLINGLELTEDIERTVR